MIILIMLTIIKYVNNNNNVLINFENKNDNEKHVMCVSSTFK